MLPSLAWAQARDDQAPSGGGWMDRFFGYAAYKSGYYQRAIDLWMPLAEAGDTRAQDYVKAIAWYERAAKSGDMAAQYNLGRIYMKGEIVEKDLERARDLLQRAADQGDSDAEALVLALPSS
jgi:TPR repeat protein